MLLEKGELDAGRAETTAEKCKLRLESGLRRGRTFI